MSEIHKLLIQHARMNIERRILEDVYKLYNVVVERVIDDNEKEPIDTITYLVRYIPKNPFLAEYSQLFKEAKQIGRVKTLNVQG